MSFSLAPGHVGRAEGVFWRCRDSERCDVVFGGVRSPFSCCHAGASRICILLLWGALLQRTIRPHHLPPPALSHHKLCILFLVIFNSCCSLVILCVVQGGRIPAVSLRISIFKISLLHIGNTLLCFVSYRHFPVHLLIFARVLRCMCVCEFARTVV